MSKGTIITMLGVAVTIVSVFMNWYSYDFIGTAMTLKPWEVSTGKLLLVVALLAAGLSYVGSTKRKKELYIGTFVMGLILMLVVFANYPGSDYEGITIEMGFWLSLVGGILITVGGVMGIDFSKIFNMRFFTSIALFISVFVLSFFIFSNTLFKEHIGGIVYQVDANASFSSAFAISVIVLIFYLKLKR